MKTAAKVAFYFDGTAVEVPVGQEVTLHRHDGYTVTGHLAGVVWYEEGPEIKVAVGHGLEGMFSYRITAVDWNGRRYQDRISR